MTSPANIAERIRLERLHALNILDTPRDAEIDRVVELAAEQFDAPISLVSLIDADRQWFKSCYGLAVSETPREVSFCAHAIRSPDILIIRDATQDPRFRDNPFVKGEPGIRFYAGAPIVLKDGLALGTLCVVDNKPREFSAANERLLRGLADIVTRHIEAHDAEARERAAIAETLNDITNSPDTVFWLSTPGIARMVFVSESYELIWGRSRQSLYDDPRSFVQAIHEDDRQSVIDGFSQHADGVWDFEYRIIRPDGEVRWIKDVGRAIRDSDGNLRGMTGAARDITREQIFRQHQMFQTRSLNRLDSILNAAMDGVMVFNAVFDAEGEIVDLQHVEMNVRAAEIIGRPRSAIIGKLLSETFPGNWEMGIFDRYKQAILGGEPDEFELHYDLDGLDHWFKVAAVPWERGGVTVTFSDISSERRAYRQLAVRERELRMVLDNVPQRIWYKDDQNTILLLNEAAADSMGSTVAEIEGRNAYDLFGDMAAKYHADDRVIIDSGQPLRNIIERYTPENGTHGWITTDKIPFQDAETGEASILVVATDITDLKRIEEELKLANENLSHFASIASHDLQAPLRHIGMYAELLGEELGDGIPETARESLDGITRGVTRMRGIVQSVYELTRVSSSDVRLVPVNLDNVLADVREVLAADLEAIEATVTVAPLPTVVGDAGLLLQVFENLISNSIKYRSDRPLRIDVSAKSEHGALSISVADNGPGILVSDTDQVFDIFKRVENQKQRAGGLGIGLAFCRKALTRMGGTISLDTAFDGGARFVIGLDEVGQRDKHEGRRS